MPPASFVRPGISSGDVWTLSIATEKLISTPLLRLSLIADAWPAPFVCFLLTYEHLFTPLFFLGNSSARGAGGRSPPAWVCGAPPPSVPSSLLPRLRRRLIVGPCQVTCL